MKTAGEKGRKGAGEQSPFLPRTLSPLLLFGLLAGPLQAQVTNPYPMRNIVVMLPATYAGDGFEAVHFDPRVRDGVLYLWPREDTGGGTNTINGITNLNGQTLLVQTFATGTAGTDFAIASAAGVHTWNLPTASSANRGALSSADWTTFNAKQGQITWQTQGVTLATAPTTVNWTTGVTGYVSGATALLGVNVAAGSSTNALVQTNGVNVGDIGTLNFIGATGAVISGVATIGGFGGSGVSTQFVTTAHGSLTSTNGLFFPPDVAGFDVWLGPWDSAGVAFTNSTHGTVLFVNMDEGIVQVGGKTVNGVIRLGDVTGATVRDLLQIASGRLNIGESAIETLLLSSITRPDSDNTKGFGSNNFRWNKGWFGTDGLFSGRLSLTNKPGEGNPWVEWRDTNANGYTRIQRTNNAGIFDTNVWWMSFANPSAGQVRKIHSVTWDAAGVAHIVETNAADNTGGAGSSLFNVNQFSASSTHTNIKDGALFTNTVNYAMTNLGAFSNSGPAFLGGFVDATGPNTNRTQLNLPHLTVSRSAILNAQGDLTNSSAASNWSLYDTNLLFGAAGNSGEVQFNQSGALAATNRFMYDRLNNRLISSNNNFDAAIAVTSPNLGYSNYMYADGMSTPLAFYNLHLADTAAHAISANYWRFSTTELFYNPGSNTVDLGIHNHPWKTNYSRWLRAYEGLQITSESAATNSVTFQITNAVMATNIFVFSVTNPVAGQVMKFHNVQNVAGGATIIVLTNDTAAAGSGTVVTFGTVKADFGAAPGSDIASVAVGSQAAITTNSSVRAWKVAEATEDHSDFDAVVSHFDVACTLPTAGVGFTIYAMSRQGRLTGKYKLNWAWNN